MESRLKFLGNPVHPMMVHLPIALYTTSLLGDLAFLWQGDPFWYLMAFTLIVLGLLSHLVAAASGLVDYLVIAKDKTTAVFRTARLHLLTGVVLLVVYVVNLGVRLAGGLPPEGQPWLPVILNLIGNGVLALQGRYGGELVYRHGIGVEKPSP